MPSGRDGMGQGMSVHIPPAGYQAPPLLQPKGVVYSNSFYMDLSKFW